MIDALWIKAALIRAIRTFAQAAIVALPSTAFTLGEVNWIIVGSTAVGAAIVSLLMSVASLPEVEAQKDLAVAEDLVDYLADQIGEAAADEEKSD